MSNRLVGITVLPEYIQSEGIEAVLDRLVSRCHANAVTVSPYVMAPADEKSGGVREPPIDAGAGAVRLLDRPLWGRREQFVRTAPSFVPDQSLYRGLRYQPTEPDSLTLSEGKLVGAFLRAARERGLKTYLQIQAAIPPGYRVQFGGPIEDDVPRLPDGSRPGKRVANNGSLASPEIIKYEHALVRDLLRAYPDLDGIRFDWPEYPPYLLNSVFLDFGPHAKQKALDWGYDFDEMRSVVSEVYRLLHGGLTNGMLDAWLEADGGRYALLRLLVDRPEIGEWLRFKARLVEEFLAGLRSVMEEEGGTDKELLAHAFPPPFQLVSGIHFQRCAKYVSSFQVKLYSMHWAMILHFYGTQILESNPGLSEEKLTRLLVRLLDIADDEGFRRLSDYAYPGPNDPHPTGGAAQTRKIRQAQRDAGEVPVQVLAHSYGPVDDFEKRLRIAWNAGQHGVWVNRYGYLSDAKMEVIGSVTQEDT